MKPEDYGQGDAFQAEKRTIFSSEWLPICANAQIAKTGDFLAATVGGWSVVAIRDRAGTVRVLRNACRHQNMPVVGQPSGQCEVLRCRFHGWTYDLSGHFVSAPPPVAPANPKAAGNNLASLAIASDAGIVFFCAGEQAPAVPQLGAILPDYGGTIVTEVDCNWKIMVEHLLCREELAPGFVWQSPLLALRRAGGKAIVEQIVPHTFLRTRLFTHVFGDAIDGHRQAAGIVKEMCERLQADRVAGAPAPEEGVLLGQFHRDIDRAYARDLRTT